MKLPKPSVGIKADAISKMKTFDIKLWEMKQQRNAPKPKGFDMV
jgi:hypothetical protein